MFRWQISIGANPGLGDWFLTEAVSIHKKLGTTTT